MREPVVVVTKEQRVLYNRRYREKHADELRANNRRYYRDRMLADPEWAEQRREKNRQYAARPDVIAKKNAVAKRKRAEDPEWAERARLIERRSSQRPAAREAHRLYEQTWRAANLERERIRHASNQAKRRTQLRGGHGEFVDRAVVYGRDGGKCHICSRPVSRLNFHIDHLIPVSKGGGHTYNNVAIAHPRCNIKRGAGRLPAQLRLVG